MRIARRANSLITCARSACMVGLTTLIVGCSGARPLMPTPTICLDAAGPDPFEHVVPAYQSSAVDMLYATDRVIEPKKSKPDVVFYGAGRSPSLAWGGCAVTIGKDVTWETLVRESRLAKRDVNLDMTVTTIKEMGRFPETPHLSQADIDNEKTADAAFLEEFTRRLALTQRKEAFIFIHGYHDSFDAAACTAAEMWHFLGREGVPIVYTWPAGHGGLLKGYDYDQESGQFTVYHLKRFIALLASCPDLKSISILSHSRGTVVAVDAVREMCIASRGEGKNPREQWKFNNLVFAAADIDVMVATQRVCTEVAGCANSITAYTSSHDKALGLSGWLFADRRLGRLDYKDLTDFERSIINGARGTSVIDDHLKSKGIGHGYFHSVPEVSSDLILLLRDNRAPGAANGRPLTVIGANYYEIDAGYPHAQPPADSPATPSAAMNKPSSATPGSQ